MFEEPASYKSEIKKLRKSRYWLTWKTRIVTDRLGIKHRQYYAIPKGLLDRDSGKRKKLKRVV
jgi:hypothetical protein